MVCYLQSDLHGLLLLVSRKQWSIIINEDGLYYPHTIVFVLQSSENNVNDFEVVFFRNYQPMSEGIIVCTYSSWLSFLVVINMSSPVLYTMTLKKFYRRIQCIVSRPILNNRDAPRSFVCFFPDWQNCDFVAVYSMFPNVKKI